MRRVHCLQRTRYSKNESGQPLGIQRSVMAEIVVGLALSATGGGSG